MRHLYICWLAIIVVALTSCRGGNTPSDTEVGDTLQLKYASLLTIVSHKDYTEATVRNPWKKGTMLHRYYLVPSDSVLPDFSALPEGTIVRTPVRGAAVFSTVHCSLLMQLLVGECIVGVADLKYIKIPYIHEGVEAGHIADCGNGQMPVLEKIIDVKPDIVMLSPFENSGGYGRLEELDIPLIECAEYMETSPLARAEWMRFYGMLFGQADRADSLFAVVDSSYQALCRQAREAGLGRSVLIDKMAGSVWYVPGGQSTIGQMLSDAGARYCWADDDHSGSLSLSFETVLERGGDADVWLCRYGGDRPLTLHDLKNEYKGYAQLKAFRTGEVFGCNVEQSLFYEQSPFRPDYLLSDFIQIIHPDITNLPPLRYYQKLQ